MLGTRAERIAIVNADTDRTPYDTGTFASTGTVVGGPGGGADRRRRCATTSSTSPPAHAASLGASAGWSDDAVVCGNRRIALAELHAAGAQGGHRFEARRKAYLSPRTVAFNVQGVRRRRASRHRRDPHPAERACRRHRHG